MKKIKELTMGKHFSTDKASVFVDYSLESEVSLLIVDLYSSHTIKLEKEGFDDLIECLQAAKKFVDEEERQ